MTPGRPLARLLVRTLVVFGGAGAFLVVGAAVAGAAEAPPAPVPPAPHVVSVPESVTVAVRIPPVLAPLAPAVPTVSVRIPGLSADVNGTGAGVGVDAAPLVSAIGDPALPTLPTLPTAPGLPSVPGVGTPADAPAGAADPAPVLAPLGASRGDATARAGHHASDARARLLTPARAGNVVITPRPSAPSDPLGVPAPPLLFALAAVAAGIQTPSRRRTSLDPVGVLATPPTVGFLDRLRTLVRLVVEPSRPGFGLNLARPG